MKIEESTVGGRKPAGKKVSTSEVRIEAIQTKWTKFRDGNMYYQVKTREAEFVFFPVLNNEVAKIEVGDICIIDFVRQGIHKVIVQIREVRKSGRPPAKHQDRFR